MRVPRPGALSAASSPPCASTSDLRDREAEAGAAVARARAPRRRGRSARRRAAGARARCPGRCRRPRTRRRPSVAPHGDRRPARRRGVCLSALSSRISSTCCSRSGSASTRRRRLGRLRRPARRRAPARAARAAHRPRRPSRAASSGASASSSWPRSERASVSRSPASRCSRSISSRTSSNSSTLAAQRLVAVLVEQVSRRAQRPSAACAARARRRPRTPAGAGRRARSGPSSDRPGTRPRPARAAARPRRRRPEQQQELVRALDRRQAGPDQHQRALQVGRLGSQGVPAARPPRTIGRLAAVRTGVRLGRRPPRAGRAGRRRVEAHRLAVQRRRRVGAGRQQRAGRAARASTLLRVGQDAAVGREQQVEDAALEALAAQARRRPRSRPRKFSDRLLAAAGQVAVDLRRAGCARCRRRASRRARARIRPTTSRFQPTRCQRIRANIRAHSLIV